MQGGSCAEQPTWLLATDRSAVVGREPCCSLVLKPIGAWSTGTPMLCEWACCRGSSRGPSRASSGAAGGSPRKEDNACVKTADRGMPLAGSAMMRQGGCRDAKNATCRCHGQPHTDSTIKQVCQAILLHEQIRMLQSWSVKASMAESLLRWQGSATHEARRWACVWQASLQHSSQENFSPQRKYLPDQHLYQMQDGQSGSGKCEQMSGC